MWTATTPGAASQNRPMTTSAYRFSEDPADLDMDRVHQWLSVESYWAKGRERAVLERAFAGSHVAGFYAGREQVAVARVVSDGATFSYLCDVYVDAAHRGHGLGRRLMEAVLERARAAGCSAVSLEVRTDNAIARRLYQSLGFGAGFAELEFWVRPLE